MSISGTRREGSGRNADGSIDMQRQVLVNCMKKKLKNLSPLSTECCIYEVPKRLRKINEEAYTPLRVSIGPIHHGQKDLEPMEKHKWRYLDDFLYKTRKPLEEYVKFIEEREDRIRKCYAETIKMSSCEFVEIILVDAVFIIELLMRNKFHNLVTQDDRIFLKPWMIEDINRDITLLENQLPFFILRDLFGMANINVKVGSDPNRYETPTFIELTRKFFVDSTNLVDLTEQVHIPQNDDSSLVEHFIDFLRRCLVPRKEELLHNTKREIDFIRSATELHEAGVKFKASSWNNLFDIKFDSGVLELPRIKITDSTECLLRNLTAFEQCHCSVRFMIDYIVLMDCLINTTKDVELLVQAKVIDNWQGDSKYVMKLFNKLCIEVTLGKNFYFSELFEDLNKYCTIPRHKWKATLRHDYCNTPWRVLSIVVAFLLLVLTFIQAMCSLATVNK